MFFFSKEKHKKRKSLRNDKIKKGFLIEDSPKSIIAEAYRTLRTNIQYSSVDKEIKTIAITSAEMGEGKTTVAGNIALTFAESEKKVILIDCDLRRPAVHKNFKTSNLTGISEVLLGEITLEEAVKKYNNNMNILTSGKIPPNPAEMLASSTMTNLIEKLKKEYDIVILDTAPIKVVTDAQILGAKVDGTILVIRAGKTKKEAAIEAKNLLDKVGANILGSILYAVEITGKEYDYYYGNKE